MMEKEKENMARNRIRCMSYPRVGLLGNPSDGYEGRTIAFTFKDFHAEVTIEPSDRLRIQPSAPDNLEFESLHSAVERFAADNRDDGLRLLWAALYRFTSCVPLVQKMDKKDPRLRFSINYQTNIPRQVGFAGSSAIIVSALRALTKWFEVQLPRLELSEMALAAEVEDLGIQAGPMDRVIQVYGGLMAMDFRQPRNEASYQRLDASLLPPLFIAWDPDGAKTSGEPHGELRKRFERGEQTVRSIIPAFRQLVDEGVDCLERLDEDRFRVLMDQNFHLRTQIFPISNRDHEMVALARQHHASAKLCGSGGAIVGSPSANCQWEKMSADFIQRGFSILRPQLEDI